MQLILIYLLFVFFVLVSSSIANDDENEMTLENFQKMKGKEIRKWLKLRNLECKGCTEKNDFVSLAYENRNVEIVPPKVDENDNNVDEDNNKDAKMDDIMATLKEAGLGGNVFNAADLKGMNEDELKNYFTTGGKAKSRNNNKKVKKERKRKEEEEETLEL